MSAWCFFSSLRAIATLQMALMYAMEEVAWYSPRRAFAASSYRMHSKKRAKAIASASLMPVERETSMYVVKLRRIFMIKSTSQAILTNKCSLWHKVVSQRIWTT